MRKIVIIILLMAVIVMPVQAVDLNAPTAPEDAQELLSGGTGSFGRDLWIVVTRALAQFQPELAEAVLSCTSIFSVALVVSVLKNLPGKSAQIADFAGVLAVSLILLQRTDSLIHLAADTVTELSEYGKLLLPVMTAALASQGGLTASTALYTGTAVFDAVLSSAVAKLLVPMVYIFLALSIGFAASDQRILGKLRDLIQWLVTWCLKMVVYIFTGFMGITGVVSGATDAATVKAAKLTMSGMVPVIGGILSDATESVLVGAGVVKSAVGVYGLLALIAIWITPFLQLGVQYLLLKLTAALCELFDTKGVNTLVRSFASAMGLLLGMTGTVCVLLVISTVCFMKGVA